MEALNETLNEIQQHLNDEYVGFRPNKGSVKLVHIADGILRSIGGASYNPKDMLKIAFVSDKKGNVPRGYELDEVYQFLCDKGIIEEKHFSKDGLQQLRPMLQSALNADGGYFLPDKTGMRALSGASIEFMTDETLYADAGDFIGNLIKKYSDNLYKALNSKLKEHSDSLSILFEPLFASEGAKDFSVSEKFEELRLWKKDISTNFFEEFLNSADCLSKYSDCASKNNILRWSVLFGAWHIVRYMSALEEIYFDGKKRPFLLDFGDGADNSIAKASGMSYTQIYQSVSRFYENALADYLSRKGYDKKDLLDTETPIYERNKPAKNKAELDGIWDIAKEDAKDLEEEDAMKVFGRSIFDMLALEASSHPLIYIRALGTKAGIFYPPVNTVPNKRFKLSNDIIEMLVRACVEPGEILTMDVLQKRMWERFNVIIGGRNEDEQILNNAGIYLADKDALSANSKSFADLLENMDFASIMADGILQINIGG